MCVTCAMEDEKERQRRVAEQKSAEKREQYFNYFTAYLLGAVTVLIVWFLSTL